MFRNVVFLILLYLLLGLVLNKMETAGHKRDLYDTRFFFKVRIS